MASKCEASRSSLVSRASDTYRSVIYTGGYIVHAEDSSWFCHPSNQHEQWSRYGLADYLTQFSLNSYRSAGGFQSALFS